MVRKRVRKTTFEMPISYDLLPRNGNVRNERILVMSLAGDMRTSGLAAQVSEGSAFGYLGWRGLPAFGIGPTGERNESLIGIGHVGR
jgi:hypothetical protein